MVEEKDTENEFVTEDEAENRGDIQEIDLETEEEMQGEKLKALREKLRDCEEEKRKNLEDLQRTKADFLNSRRRLEEQLARDKERAKDGIIFDLLALVDSFDTAIADPSWKQTDEKWRTGIEAMHTKLLSILKSHDVVPIEAVGKPFNPEEHEAVSSIPVTDEGEAEKVVTVLQKGFKRNETVLRPAKVVVGTK